MELIAHALADEETSTIQVAHHQSVARQKCKLVADFGVRMHLAWAQHLLDNREFVQMKGRFPSSGPRCRKGDVAYDSDEEERDLYQQDLYMNAGRNRHGGQSNRPGWLSPPRPVTYEAPTSARFGPLHSKSPLGGRSKVKKPTSRYVRH